MKNFEESISNLDIKLFEKIKSQSTEFDKQSFLACQLAVRELHPHYNYLEIGSYLGGSIQPHLLDDKCARIYSLDKRPLQQPDARGVDFIYQNNSTARMLEQLNSVAADKMYKITTIDGDTREISADVVKDKIQFCFIDGEHTDQAVFSDFQFCLKVLDENGAIAFHDSEVTYNGISACIEYLEKKSIKFRAYSLPSVMFVIEIGDFPIHKNPVVLERLTNNYRSYIFSLQNNDYYRQFANKPPFRFYRKIIGKIKKTNISE